MSACTAAVEKRARLLAPFLESLARRYHHPRYLGSDPLVVVRSFDDPADREVAALFAALLAYGSVKQINGSLARLFALMGGRPGRFVRDFHPRRSAAALRDFKHRFTDGEDVAVLCHLLAQAMADAPLGERFAAMSAPGDTDLAPAAARFFSSILSLDTEPVAPRARIMAKQGFRHFIPNAAGTSASKRIHLFLRWMVRPDDGIDLGLWPGVAPARLLVPVDTHILRVGGYLGLLRHKTNSLAASREITAALLTVDPADPVRFDFSLCRLGILGACPPASRIELCRDCEMHDPCARRRRLDRPRPAA